MKLDEVTNYEEIDVRGRHTISWNDGYLGRWVEMMDILMAPPISFKVKPKKICKPGTFVKMKVIFFNKKKNYTIILKCLTPHPKKETTNDHS